MKCKMNAHTSSQAGPRQHRTDRPKGRYRRAFACLLASWIVWGVATKQTNMASKGKEMFIEDFETVLYDEEVEKAINEVSKSIY